MARDNRRPRVSYRNNSGGGGETSFPPFFFSERKGGVGISSDRILIGMKCAEIDSYRDGTFFFLRKTRKRLHPIKTAQPLLLERRRSSLLIVNVDININDPTVIISSNEY